MNIIWVCHAPAGIWNSGPTVTSEEYVDSYRKRGYTCLRYVLSPEKGTKECQSNTSESGKVADTIGVL